MKNEKLIRAGLVLAAVLLVFFIFKTLPLFKGTANLIDKVRIFSYERISFIGDLGKEIAKFRTLEQENMRLNEENRELTAQLAGSAELKVQNDFLRESLGIPAIRGRSINEAGVYNVQTTPKGEFVLINKGGGDGLKKDDIVISSSGILIGIIDKVFDKSSQVMMVSSSDFKITVAILLKTTSGIAQGALNEGMTIDLVSQNEDINVGDTVVSSGNDIFPPGLVVGKVLNVESNNANLFKTIKVRPALNDINLSRVLIVSQ